MKICIIKKETEAPQWSCSSQFMIPSITKTTKQGEHMLCNNFHYRQNHSKYSQFRTKTEHKDPELTVVYCKVDASTWQKYRHLQNWEVWIFLQIHPIRKSQPDKWMHAFTQDSEPHGRLLWSFSTQGEVQLGKNSLLSKMGTNQFCCQKLNSPTHGLEWKVASPWE